MTLLSYRKCVVIFVIKDSKIFVGKRIDTKDAWQLPQGGVEENESFPDAAKRELLEETGISSVELLGSFGGCRYDFPPHIRRVLEKKRGQLKYCGQEITFFAFKFLGEESEICLSGSPQEFVDWTWIFPDDLLKKIVYFKKDSYLRAVEEFRRLKII
ncbi:MAG: RNA pyrophosphohydrolase [Holosporaceae bacterium]|nr:RNA pyrophosphohydrolase [Holosporaceae bacterium]